MSNTTVHVLHHGLPLCQFSTEVPAEWPKHHIWARASEWNTASSSRRWHELKCVKCPTCDHRVKVLAK